MHVYSTSVTSISLPPLSFPIPLQVPFPHLWLFGCLFCYPQSLSRAFCVPMGLALSNGPGGLTFDIQLKTMTFPHTESTGSQEFSREGQSFTSLFLIHDRLLTGPFSCRPSAVHHSYSEILFAMAELYPEYGISQPFSQSSGFCILLHLQECPYRA